MALQGCLSFHWAHDNVWGYSEGIFAWRAFWSLPVGTLEVSFILYSSQYIWECSGQLGQELKRNYNLLGFIPSLLLHLYCFERCGMHKNTFTFWWIPPLCFKNFLVWTLQLFLLCNPCSAIHAVQAWRNLEFYCLIILGLLLNNDSTEFSSLT